MMHTEIKKTPLYEQHIKLTAKIVDFHGWLMPLQYKGIIAEHLAVRNNAGIFDVSHMGQIHIKGRDVYNFVQYLVPNNLDKIEPGRSLYSALCNESGYMIDDLIIYMISREHIFLIVNASNVENDFNWILAHKSKYDVDIENKSMDVVLIALQGPSSPAIMEKFLNHDISSLRRFNFKEFSVSGNRIIVSRTGYTGEDGFELSINADKGVWLWEQLMKFNPEPVGLGARDTLRLEKGYILYGNDADLNTTPIDAGIGWTVDLNKNDFIGKKALMNYISKKKLIRFEMTDGGIPRNGCDILCDSEKIGFVTSGSYSPSAQKGIGMGYIEKECGAIQIDIRGRFYNAIIKN